VLPEGDMEGIRMSTQNQVLHMPHEAYGQKCKGCEGVLPEGDLEIHEEVVSGGQHARKKGTRPRREDA